MGVTREDLKRTGRWLAVSDKEWEEELKTREYLLFERYIPNDKWANLVFKKVGILITSHSSNRPYLRACIDSHRELGYWITLVYDNFIDPTYETMDYNHYLPPRDIMQKVNLFILNPFQTWGGVLYPFFWSLKFGAAAMKDFEYIYCVNGDFILEKPEGFPKLLELLGNHDILSYGPNEDKSVSTCFIARTSALLKIIQHIQDHFIPFENYEKYTQDYGNAEGRFARAIRDLNFSIAPVDPPFNEQMHVPGKGTWYETVGFRHIHGEHNYAYRRKGIPPSIEYLDERFMGDEYNVIKKYWETKDKSILGGWWAK